MKNVRIAWHDIELWLDVDGVLENDDNIELSDVNEEHITNAIIDWYREGELLQVVYKDDNNEEGEECRGWWKIKKD